MRLLPVRNAPERVGLGWKKQKPDADLVKNVLQTLAEDPLNLFYQVDKDDTTGLDILYKGIRGYEEVSSNFMRLLSSLSSV